jgi:hypothetical protein
VVPAGSIPTEASLLLAMYAAARTIPLALFAMYLLHRSARISRKPSADERALRPGNHAPREIVLGRGTLSNPLRI